MFNSVVFATVQNALYLLFETIFRFIFIPHKEFILLFFIKKEDLINLSVDLALDKLWMFAETKPTF